MAAAHTAELQLSTAEQAAQLAASAKEVRRLESELAKATAAGRSASASASDHVTALTEKLTLSESQLKEEADRAAEAERRRQAAEARARQSDEMLRSVHSRAGAERTKLAATLGVSLAQLSTAQRTLRGKEQLLERTCERALPLP